MAGTGEEIDPLDAFMAGISSEVTKQEAAVGVRDQLTQNLFILSYRTTIHWTLSWLVSMLRFQRLSFTLFPCVVLMFYD
jgi:hypothetical protein